MADDFCGRVITAARNTLSFDWLPNRQKCGRLRVEPMSEGLTVKPANAAAKYAFPDAKKTRTVASAGFLVVK